MAGEQIVLRFVYHERVLAACVSFAKPSLADEFTRSALSYSRADSNHRCCVSASASCCVRARCFDLAAALDFCCWIKLISSTPTRPPRDHPSNAVPTRSVVPRTTGLVVIRSGVELLSTMAQVRRPAQE